jgi:molybdopterin-containing oxidoreductase family iron-sulfur binding subunit
MSRLDVIHDHPHDHDDPPPRVSRRELLELLGASLALAGGACTRQPLEKIVPRAKRPEDAVPGKPRYFATAMPFGYGALGILAETHEGRPTKIEGNPDHPASLGGTDVFAQAAILDLYSPDRARAITETWRASSWDVLAKTIQTPLEKIRLKNGAGLAILSQPILSPTLARQRASLLSKMPAARWHQWTPIHRDAERAGAILAFDRDVSTRFELSKAEVILSLGSNLLDDGPAFARYARDYAARRRDRRVRMYAMESAPSLTGAASDHLRVVPPQDLDGMAYQLAGGAPKDPFAAGLLRDLEAARGRSVVVVGREQSPELHAIGHALNARLGNVGQTVFYADPIEAYPESAVESIRTLVSAIGDGAVELLIILGGNPVYDAPADLDLAKALDLVPLRVHVGLEDDETTRACHWHVPETHFLESWSDTVAFDGTRSIVQPTIAPLYAGKSLHEVVELVLGNWNATTFEVVRETWKHLGDLEWRKALHDGVIHEPPRPSLALSAKEPPFPKIEKGMEHVVVFRPDPTIWDGRFANNGWLQELPKVHTRLTWDNAILMGPKDAARRNVALGDVVRLTVGKRSVTGPVVVQPGTAEGVVVVHLGYGRSAAGPIGRGKGFDAQQIRTAGQWLDRVSVEKTGDGPYTLAITQDHHSMEGRNLARSLPIAELGHGGAHHGEHHSLMPAHPYDGHAWGMVIDLTSCIGCNACTIACQAENNIPVVGKKEAANGREMHWIRVDRYYEGDLAEPDTRHQPVPCMHCENAPCETVCPVAATVHSSEGLNDMVYNRCVGTRYCANNCPYKVRRFNFYLFQIWEEESLKLARNPDVTIRSRGVMEKCTYCVQRINEKRFERRLAGEPLGDGDIVTACQQACPAQAITFGDINDAGSKISKLRREPHHYGILEELNTAPRTTYLSRVTNPRAPGGGKEG